MLTPISLGDDVREGGLAEAGRAAEQQVVERLAAAPRGLDEDRRLSTTARWPTYSSNVWGRSAASKLGVVGLRGSLEGPAPRAWVRIVRAVDRARQPAADAEDLQQQLELVGGEVGGAHAAPPRQRNLQANPLGLAVTAPLHRNRDCLGSLGGKDVALHRAQVPEDTQRQPALAVAKDLEVAVACQRLGRPLRSCSSSRAASLRTKPFIGPA